MNIPKFRAWHKQRQIMMPVLQIDLDPEHGGVFVESSDGSHCGCRLHMELWPWSDIELMQWTGLNDRHNTGIYENDIITWCGEQYTVIFSSLDGNWLLKDDREDWDCPSLYAVSSPKQSRIAVISNIYEYHKLLETQSQH